MHKPIYKRSKLASNLTALVLGVVILTACGKKQEAPLGGAAAGGAAAPSAAVQSKMVVNGTVDAKSEHVADGASVVAVEAPLSAKRAAQLSSAVLSAAPAGRQLIRAAQLHFSVRDVHAANLAIEDAAQVHEGYVVSSAIAEQQHHVLQHPVADGKMEQIVQYSTSGTMTVRVPSAKTQAFLRDIAKHMDVLTQRNFSASDVQFDLLRKQLEAQRNQDAQVDLGVISRQSGWVGEKGDVVQMRSQALAARNEALVAQKETADQVAFSTISLEMHQPNQVRRSTFVDTDAVIKSYSPNFFARMGQSAARGWSGLLDLLVSMMEVWPLWLVLGAVLWAVRRFGLLKSKWPFKRKESNHVV